MRGVEPDRTTAENFRRFARADALDKSPLYAALCEGVAEDPEILAFLDARPRRERQPNLLAGRRIGSAELVFPCRPDGLVPLPSSPPEVAWRAGLDLAPIDLFDQDAVAWLEALVWPEETDRRPAAPGS